MAPLGAAGAEDRVQFVDEENDAALRLADLLHHRLEPLLELAPELRAGEERPHIERAQRFVLQVRGNVAPVHALGEALDDRGLADPSLADDHRVVLRAPVEDLHHAADLRVAPDHRVELAFGRELGEVGAVLLQNSDSCSRRSGS